MEELLQPAIEFIQANVEIAPYLIFGLLLLAGLNIPVSEDGMLFISGLLAAQRPDLMWELFVGVYLGAYFSDLICYSLGRFFGPRLWNIKWFAKMVSREAVHKMSGFYERYGFLTLLVGRFIPFGVRNALFLTAGISKMNAVRFAVADLIAATISCGIYFWLYYSYGETVITYVKQFNYVIFGAALLGVVVVLVRKRQGAKASADIPLDTTDSEPNS